MSNLQITFLGTSASVPTPKRGLPSVALRWQGNIFLFDCGEGTQRQMMQYKVGYGSLRAIFISHLHLDHFLGIYGLIETLHLHQPSPKEVDIFTPQGLSLINNYQFIRQNEIKKRGGTLLQGNDFSINSFSVKHTTISYGFVFEEKHRRKFHEEKAHSLGIRGKMFSEIQSKGSLIIKNKKILLDEVSYLQSGKKIVYSGDCMPSENLIKASKNADILIHESTFSDDKGEEAKERMHSTALQAAEIAKQANAKKLILTHISPRYGEAAELEKLLGEARLVFQNTVLAFDGLTISL